MVSEQHSWQQTVEPVFRGQEQGVVYFFSRYWHKLPEFQNKKLYDIQTQFPDASMVDTSGSGEVREAIEFEYALSSFDHHHEPRHMKKLKKYKSLYVVYWDQDRDEAALRAQIAKKGFEGKVVFVCLNRYFSPVIEPGAEHLRTFWEFRADGKRFVERYDFHAITERTNTLAKLGTVELHQAEDGLYRTIGFNKTGSDFIECDHWKCIHLFTTTTRFACDVIPQRLFVKPTGCDYFSGFFDVAMAFSINEDTALLRNYFEDFYFYPFDHEEHTCFVYSRFRELSYGDREDPGVALFNYLAKEGIRLDVRGSKVISARRHIKEIDKIVEGAD